MKPLLHPIITALLLLWFIGQANAQELFFASTVEARHILSSKDAFVLRMSPFDRSARLKADRDISEGEYLKFAASAALEWKQSEKRRVDSAFHKIQPAVARLSLPLPARIYVVKTSGNEEGNAAYTRDNAIVLPTSIIASPDEELQRVLAHELLHIATRAYPKLAKMLYESIGFHYCGEVEFPPKLVQRKITNPDAPVNDYCIRLQVGGEEVWAVPILFSNAAKYDASRGGEFFQYLQLALMLVEKPTEGSTTRQLYDSRGPRLVGLNQVSGFFEQVGRNTDYIIHPEEILADNFALLVLGQRNVSSPEILEKIRSTLAKSKETGPRSAKSAPKPAPPLK